ncbi:uncharacterized protein F54H12.2 [Trichonephila clavipes]|nr:uncharacterized protein F54H12.2 [Trichonephila clavipes]
MPKRIVLACVDNDAFNGNYKKSPFEFNHYNLNFIGVYIDGQPMPHQPLELDFEKENVIRAYQSLFLISEGLYLSINEFAKRYSLFLFDLTPDLCDGEHFNLIRHNKLPLIRRRSTVIVNTDTQDQEGSHWLAMHIRDENTIEFFDSYGFPQTACMLAIATNLADCKQLWSKTKRFRFRIAVC